jgi:hypothetical protein
MIYLRSVLILSSIQCLGLANDLFPSGFPIKTLYAILLSPTRATCSAHLILLDLITWIIFAEEKKSQDVPQHAVSSSTL